MQYEETVGRYTGCLLGLAAGDAVGTSVEFSPPGTFTPITDMVGGGPFRLRPGQWTDDTSMALCLAESLIECEGFEPADQLRRYVQWWRAGHLSSTGTCFDIGSTTIRGLSRFMRTGEVYDEDLDQHSAANGSLMRLAPVALAYATQIPQAIHYSGLSSRTTHGSRLCIDSCRYMGHLITLAVQGVLKDELLAPPPAAVWGQEPLCPEIAEVASGSFARRDPPAIRGTGYVVDALESALWAFHHGEDYRHAVLLAVNLGDDADTTGAIAGQLAGAYYGKRGIPEGWLSRLACRELIERYAHGLLVLARAEGGDEKGDPA